MTGQLKPQDAVAEARRRYAEVPMTLADRPGLTGPPRPPPAQQQQLRSMSLLLPPTPRGTISSMLLSPRSALMCQHGRVEVLGRVPPNPWTRPPELSVLAEMWHMPAPHGKRAQMMYHTPTRVSPRKHLPAIDGTC